MRPGGFGISRIRDSAVTLLPEPDSPTMASVWPASTLKQTLVDRGQLAALGAKARRQAIHFEQGSGHALVSLGAQNPIFFFISWSIQMRAWIGPGRSAPARSSPP